MDIIGILLYLSVLLVVAFLWLQIQNRIERTESKTQKLIERNSEVYKFRLWMLNNMPEHYERLPEYDEMVYDDKPLNVQSYIPELNN